MTPPLNPYLDLAKHPCLESFSAQYQHPFVRPIRAGSGYESAALLWAVEGFYSPDELKEGDPLAVRLELVQYCPFCGQELFPPPVNQPLPPVVSLEKEAHDVAQALEVLAEQTKPRPHKT